MHYDIKQKYGSPKCYILNKPVSHKHSIQVEKDQVKKGEIPPPVMDCVFKHMFAREETKIFACLLMGTVLDLDPYELERKMFLAQNEIVAEIYKGRTVRLDFVGKVDDIIFNIEMNQKNSLERNNDYIGKLYSIECREGSEKYDTVYQMNINNFRLIGENTPIDINEMTNGRLARSKIIVIDIYLPIIYEKYKKGKALSEEERMILWMFIGNEKEMKKIGGTDMNMKKYIKILKRFLGNKKALEEYYRELEYKESGFLEGKEIGYEQGEEIGKEKSQIDTATAMLQDGIPAEKVQKYTNLPLDKIMSIMSLL